ncbi:hypothetical protein BN9982_1900001 [Mycobacterium tuberculosis]|nr:hypothetical protein BN9982_1900001 [Mycobacterium tuberculosis]
MYGYDTTVPISIDELIPLVRGVVRGAPHALVVTDLPFDIAGVRMAPAELTGRTRSLAWELSWKDTAAPLWTFPRVAWERSVPGGASGGNQVTQPCA